MPDRSLHTARRSIVGLGDHRIEFFGNRTDQIHIFHTQCDAHSQILISFDMCGNTDFMNHIRDIDFQIGHLFAVFLADELSGRFRRRRSIFLLMNTGKTVDSLEQNLKVKRFYYVVTCAQRDRFFGKSLVAHSGKHDDLGRFAQFHLVDLLQHFKTVDIRHDVVENQHIRRFLLNFF